MRSVPFSIAALAAILPAVLGHGQVHRVITHNPVATYVAADAYGAVIAGSPIRKLSDVGPATPFTGSAITCGPGGNVPVAALAPVVAGSKITFDWTPWNSVHPGPVMTYMARCPSGCANFKGDTGNVWVKIDQDGYNPSRAIPWAEENIVKYGTYTITIPASFANGEYIVRHEILGLHVGSQLNGAQFYPNCIQIKLSGGGSANPTGIALPGAYQPQDPGILVQLYTITPSTPSYTIPGGPVIVNGGPAVYGGTIPTGGSSPTTTAGGSSGTTTASGPAQTAYGQCGGNGWTGPTSCVSGYKCSASGAYYSQCIPG